MAGSKVAKGRTRRGSKITLKEWHGLFSGIVHSPLRLLRHYVNLTVVAVLT